jgi:hypothetical protein
MMFSVAFNPNVMGLSRASIMARFYGLNSARSDVNRIPHFLPETEGGKARVEKCNPLWVGHVAMSGDLRTKQIIPRVQQTLEQ